MTRTIAPKLILVLLLAGSCSLQAPVEEESESKEVVPGVVLVPVTHAEWHQELETFKGDIVVVDMWATWCIPCVERFPRMVEMYDKYHPEGVTFVSVCLDDRDDVQAVEGARQFLVEQNATFPNYLMDENIVDAFEKLDLLGIPAVFIYDRRGELRYRLSGDDPNNQFTDRDVEEAIQTLLREGEVRGTCPSRIFYWQEVIL